MDQDGANNQYLTDGRALVLTPRFSPTAQEITYLSYAASTPRVYLFNIDTGQQELLGDFPGMTFAPRFSPDGNRVVMSLSRRRRQQHLYARSAHAPSDAAHRRHRRSTPRPAIRRTARKIVFNSDRGGSQQLYVMNADGSDMQRISFGSGNYGTPVWSPRGDLIAFTKIDGGTFFIGVMHPDGSGERLLTKDFLVEGPTWAPNGRVLMYFQPDADQHAAAAAARRGSYTIDLTGSNEREVLTPAMPPIRPGRPCFARI